MTGVQTCALPICDNFGVLAAINFGYHFEGNSIVGGTFVPVYGFVANLIEGTGTADQCTFAELSPATALPVQNNFICVNNKWMSVKLNGNPVFVIGAAQAMTGVAIVGNIFEAISNTGNVQLVSVGEGTTNQSLDSFIYAHNTTVGERNNNFYNDANNALQSNIFMAGNAVRSFNIKTDTFAGTAGLDGRRRGNWATFNGVNVTDCRWDGGAGGAFFPDYYGINTAIVGSPTVFGEMQYTAEKSIDVGGGVGNGNYLPATGSPLIGYTLSQKYLTYDMAGNNV